MSHSSGNTSRIRSRRWCLTLNNYTEEELQSCINNFQTYKHYIIGKEIGKQGTKHLQIYIAHSSQISFSTLKLINERFHIEKAKGSLKQNYLYCSKEKDFITNIELNQTLTTAELQKLEDIEILKEDYDNITWKPWQQEIINMLEQKAEKRKIYWYHEEKGNVGKSFLFLYLDIKHDVIIGEGKKIDIYNQCAQYLEEKKKFPKVVILNITRTNEGYVNYNAIETLKDGHLYSGKYKGLKIRMRTPHVLIFSNFAPDTTKLSEDRWKIKNII